MTSVTIGLPAARPFTLEECAALAAAGIIGEGEQGDVLAGVRRFNVDEYLAMERAGILHEDDRVELMDGEILVMAPIGDSHESGTDWLNMRLAPALVGRAMVRVQGSIRLNSRSAPQPDVAVLRERPFGEVGPYFPPDIYFVIEVAHSSLAYDRGLKLRRYAEAGIAEVWVANLRAREVTVYSGAAGSGYAAVRTYRAGDSIRLSAFPDVVLEVDGFMPPATG